MDPQLQVPMTHKDEITQSIHKAGFAIVAGVLQQIEVKRLILQLEQADDQTSIRNRGGVYAIRNLLEVVPAVRWLALSTEIRTLVESVLGGKAFPVRGTLFDKTPGANWKVPWHQDLSISVKTRREVPEFGPWSTKAGVLHVQPPVSVLEKMLAVRIHLDDCGESNAPLRVIPGTHRAGRLSPLQISEIDDRSVVTCLVPAGGVLLMHPLSSASRSPLHRRVIHLDFTSCALPGGLEWHPDI
jgi:hypothetical protein